MSSNRQHSDQQHPTDEIILRHIDHELPPEEATRVRAHMAECSDCHQRELAMLSTTDAITDIYRAELPPPDSYEVEPRDRLQRALAALQPSRPSHGRLLGPFSSPYGLGIAALGVLVLAFALPEGGSWRHIASPEAQFFVPNRSLTPGAVRPVTLAEVCSANDNDLDPAVSPSLQKAVLDEYGVRAKKHTREYQIDYLINPQLGGTSDIRNLWPESSSNAQWNAQVKDELERRLHQMVCAGTVDLPVAQREIATDWIAAYKKYVGTAQSSASPRLSEIATLGPHFH